MSAVPAHIRSLNVSTGNASTGEASTEARVSPASTLKPHFLDALAKRAVLQRLQQVREGQLTVIDGEDVYCFGHLTESFAVSIAVRVHDQRFYSDLAFGGSIGVSESFMQGYWTTDRLTDLVRLFVRNMDVLDAMESGLARLTTPVQKALHWLNRNTRQGSRKNIAAHYDLGNEFFKLFLDESMMYSSAIFASPDTPLSVAQEFRLRTICDKLALGPADHLLEIGTGWGGFAIFAAREYGCRVTTTTISREQYELACDRVAAAGFMDRINVLLSDYRDLDGQYDKLVSIEMIEAVGHQYYDTFFAKCSSLLKPEGLMLLQAITIADQRYERAKGTVDFIQRYIFPGSCIPSVTAMADSITRSSDMRVVHLTDIGAHYATTLARWRTNFFANLAKVRTLGFSEAFIRMWDYYFCYCEGGFAERAIGDVHMVIAKPRNRRPCIA